LNCFKIPTTHSSVMVPKIRTVIQHLNGVWVGALVTIKCQVPVVTVSYVIPMSSDSHMYDDPQSWGWMWLGVCDCLETCIIYTYFTNWNMLCGLQTLQHFTTFIRYILFYSSTFLSCLTHYMSFLFKDSTNIYLDLYFWQKEHHDINFSGLNISPWLHHHLSHQWQHLTSSV